MQSTLNFLLDLTSELAYERDTSRVLDQLSRAVRTLLNVEVCSVFLHDERTGELYTEIERAAISQIRIKDSQGIAGLVFCSREPTLIEDPYNHPAFLSEIDQQTGFRTKAILALPLRDREGKAIGVVEAINKTNGAAFDQRDIDLLGHIVLYMSAFVENALLHNDLRRSQEAVIHKLSRASRYKDEETFNHTVRVGHFALCIARAIGLPRAQCELVFLAAPMHDIGKIGIPDSIMHKPGKLTEEEYELVKGHCLIGREILGGGDSELTDTAARIAEDHHEHVNGGGYPAGKKGRAISIEGRITSIADVFDALSSARSYKKAWPAQRVYTHLRDKSGTQFDAELVQAFLADRAEIERIHLRFPDPD